MGTAAVGGFGRLQLRQCVLASALTSGRVPPNHAQGCMQTAGTCVFSKRTRRLAKLERNRDARWLELVQPHTTQQRCKAKTAETKTPMTSNRRKQTLRCRAGPPRHREREACALLSHPLLFEVLHPALPSLSSNPAFFVSPPLPDCCGNSHVINIIIIPPSFPPERERERESPLFVSHRGNSGTKF